MGIKSSILRLTFLLIFDFDASRKKLTQQQVIALERDLAKFATMMDSAVRIPFTKQGIGADAALSTIQLQVMSLGSH